MVEVDGATSLIGEHGSLSLLKAFEGRRLLIAYYFMWQAGKHASEQCEGCTWITSQVRELTYVHARDITFAVFCQGPLRRASGIETSWAGGFHGTQRVGRYRHSWKAAGWADAYCLLPAARFKGLETYWTTIRGVEAMDNNYRLLDLTAYGRQESWEESPPGWPKREIIDYLRTNGRPIAQWDRLKAGFSDSLDQGEH